MGLTFHQQFYQVPEEVYLVQFLDPGDMESARDVFAIIEKPDNDKEDFDLRLSLESEGYCVQECNFDDLIIQGYSLLKELKMR